MHTISRALSQFIKLESSSGLLLMIAALAAIIMMNSGLGALYETFFATPIYLTIGELKIHKPLFLWINDGLMAIFFFLVGLEIKREVLRGELSDLSKASLPIFAAIGGMAIPALIFVLINHQSPSTLSGWAIPAATDIAFALGILALMGTRAPTALKVFLLAVAIIDDLGAIIIIALFYTQNLSVNALMMAGAAFGLMLAMNRMNVRKLLPYILVGVFLWVCVLKSGVHATLAGVLTALMIPMGEKDDHESPLHKAEHALHPYVAFLILPIFAFANAGISFQGLSMNALLVPLPLGIMLGLFLGKPIGVLGFAFLATKLRLAKLPNGVSWLQMTGVACLTGVGFTMSLFIGGLAFSDPTTMNDVRMGVLAGSLLSGLAGASMLMFAHSVKTRTEQKSYRSGEEPSVA